MEPQRLKEIFNRYLENGCSAEELELLVIHFHTDNEKLLMSLVTAELEKTAFTATEPRIQATIDRVHKNIKENINKELYARPVRSTMLSMWPRFAAAAVILISLSVAAYFYTGNDGNKQYEFANDVKPGGNKAYLTLSDGKRIALTGANNGTLAKQGDVQVTKTSDGQLVYEITEANGNRGSGDNQVYNTIETPKGGQYQLRLPDGTRVWLNAASSLTYPASFVSLKERKVILKGEAYFEVTPNKLVPFKVLTANQEVKVLGTHFNVNSYLDEDAVRTTLLEGSVQVSSTGLYKILKPGQQSVLKDNDMKVFIVDTDNVLDWKNGDFVLREEKLESIMRKVARWYDVDIRYEDDYPKNVILGGLISRSKNVSAVLRLIESTGKVRFRIEGKIITVVK